MSTGRWAADYQPPDENILRTLEETVQASLRTGKHQLLPLLGYGEVTVAVAWPPASPLWACKRLPPTTNEDRVRAYATHIDRYVELLRAAGVAVIPTSTHLGRSASGQSVLFVVQPILPKQTLGPIVLANRPPAADDEVLRRIFASIEQATTPQLGIDPQLANWAWLDGEAWQLDVTTPFTRDELGRAELDDELVVRPFPSFLRPPLRRWVVPDVLARYHDLRSALLDFAANLKKERLDGWIGPVLDCANARLAAPLSRSEVEAYYLRDARLWETTYQAKRLSRWLCRMSGQTYQFILPPPTRR